MARQKRQADVTEERVAADGRQHLLALSVKNVKMLREVEIDDLGELHEIRGDSNQGKTSILDAIEAGLRGMDAEMVRRGAGSAEIELVLDDVRVRRVVSADPEQDETLLVSAQGKPVDNAKAFLRAIAGPTAFRPIEWVRMGGGEGKGKTERRRRQRDMLLEALNLTLTEEDVIAAVNELGDAYTAALDDVNLDRVTFEAHPFSVCRAFYEACYAHRQLMNARADAAEERLRNTPKGDAKSWGRSLTQAECAAREAAAQDAFFTARARVADVDAVRKQKDELRKRIAEEEKTLPSRDRVEHELEARRHKANGLRAEIAELERRLSAARAGLGEEEKAIPQYEALVRRHEAHEARQAELARLEGEQEDAGVDLEGLRAAYEEAKREHEAWRLQDLHEAAAHEANDARTTARIHDELVRLFRDDLPAALLAAANLPVAGLSVDEEQILIDGVPLHQLGTSAQIRLGVIIASALNPRCGFVLVDGAESMGSADRKALADIARELGMQLVLTYVDEHARPAPNVTVMRGGEMVA